MLRDEIKKRNTEIKKEQELVHQELEDLPDEDFICCRNGTRFKWYKMDGKNRVYIPKSNRAEAEQLAYKRYLESRAEDLKREARANEAYLKLFPKEKASELLMHQGYLELLRPRVKSLFEEVEAWKNAAYEKNEKYPDQLVYQTTSGSFVRSKSELMIDMALQDNHIPFRYECLLELAGIDLYPDFTICHPMTGEIYYWEHFGMLDKPSYVQNMCQKINTYTIHGIIPSINLIMTFESKDNPLNFNKINSIIKEYFL